MGLSPGLSKNSLFVQSQWFIIGCNQTGTRQYIPQLDLDTPIIVLRGELNSVYFEIRTRMD